MTTFVETRTEFTKRGHRMPGKECGCTGNRSCFLCRLPDSLAAQPNYRSRQFFFCPECGDRAFEQSRSHRNHDESSTDNPSIRIQGVFVRLEAIDEQTEQLLISDADQRPWIMSQSGRRKQDFGPKVNFKKQKVKFDGFAGLPAKSMDALSTIQSKDSACAQVLRNFDTIEICNLEYCSDRGSSIVPHLDDIWIWGDRLVTLNLASDTLLVLSKEESDMEIVIPMPRRSLLVLADEARYQWLHEVRREHVHERRLAITFRELSPEFRAEGDSYASCVGRQLLQIARNRV